MLLLDSLKAERTVALFGRGLIGSACLDALCARASWSVTEVPFAWTCTPDGPSEDARILEAVRGLPLNEKKPRRIELLWTAGRCGFGASKEDTLPEVASFERFVNIAEKLHHERQVRVSMMSSAGGLFEGQHLISRSTAPSPQRPYGILKLQQEELLRSASSGIAKTVMRPASVYGPVSDRLRQGLISVLIRNGIRRGVSTIVGTPSTQRDYVYTKDIGRFIARRILEPQPAESSASNETMILIAGRPTSIQEICHFVENAIGRRLYMRFDPPSNASDITFAADSVPSFPWRTSDLAATIRDLTRAYLAGN